jgi:hypothetical protein
MKKPLAVLFLITCSIIGSILACGAPTQLVTINVNEDLADRTLAESGDALKGTDWVFTYDRVDLQEDLMRVHGSFNYEEQPAVNGYLDTGFSVEDASLQAELITANFGDFHPAEEDLLLLIEGIEQVFKDAVAGDKKAVQYITVEMIEDLIKIQIRFLP